jgi:predicted DNA-binding transcriptional regulator AlpA
MEHSLELLTPKEVSEWTGISVAALAQLRYLGTGPRFVKPTAKTVLYIREHVESWLLECVQIRTGERVK